MDQSPIKRPSDQSSVTETADQAPPPRSGNGALESPGFHLAGWHVSPFQNRLEKRDREIRLEPKAMDVLVQLYRAGGQTVPRNRLLETVWPDTFVADDSLHRAVSKLRQGLAIDPVFENAVITVPKRGYRLNSELLRDPQGTVATVMGSPSRAAWWTSPDGRRLRILAGGVLLVGLVVMVTAILGPSVDINLVQLRSKPLTGYPGQERAPDFAPDGKRVVFAWSGADGNEWDLYIKAVGQWEPARLTDTPGPEFNPAWSPDGQTIAFVRLGGVPACRIMTIPAAGGEEEFLRNCRAGSDVDLSWSPDSKALYFTDRVGHDGPLAVHRRDLAEGVDRQVTFPPADHWGDNLVQVSPDGKRVAFARTRALGVTDVFITDGDGSVSQLTHDRLKIHGLGWSADGEDLYFSSNRGGTFGLWRMDRDGQGLAPVTLGGVNAGSVSVSPVGDRLAFESESAATRIWSVPLAAGAGQPQSAVTQSSGGWDWHPRISPDGSRIAFISDRAGTAELWAASIDGTQPIRLTNFDGPYTNVPAWSPDSKRIVVAAPVGGNFDLYVIGAGGGKATRLTEHPASDRNPAWSLDGRRIYFASNRTGRWQIWARDLIDDSITQITTDGGFRAQEVTGRRLLFVKRETAGLYSLDLASENNTEWLLYDALLPLDWSNWDVAGEAVYLIRRGEDLSATLMKLDPKTGTAAQVRTLIDFPYYSGLAVTPDGAHAVFARTDIIEADLILMERVDGADT